MVSSSFQLTVPSGRRGGASPLKNLGYPIGADPGAPLDGGLLRQQAGVARRQPRRCFWLDNGQAAQRRTADAETRRGLDFTASYTLTTLPMIPRSTLFEGADRAATSVRSCRGRTNADRIALEKYDTGDGFLRRWSAATPHPRFRLGASITTVLKIFDR